VTVDVGELWQRLSPRMLLVHPVHEVLRQITASDRVGGARLGDRQSDVDPVRAGAGRRLRRGPVVHHDLQDRHRTGSAAHWCAPAQCSFGCAQQDSLGVDRRAAVAPVARVDGATGEHGQGPRAIPRLRSTPCRPSSASAEAILLADSLAPAEDEASEPGRELARWQPSGCDYSPLSFTGLAMILAAVGWHIRRESGAALQNSRLAQSGVDAAERFGVIASVVVIAVACWSRPSCCQ